MPHASDFDAKLYQISENTQQICNKFAPKTSNIRKSKNKKEIIITHSISVILLHFCFFLLDLLSFVFAYTPSATGKRKAIVKGDVLTLMTKFNNENIPQEGRYLLLDAMMYSQLLNSLTANENSAFLASADAQNGVLGKLFSFNVMMRSRSALYTTAKAPKAWSESGEATDLAAALAWHDQSVCRALGEVKAFEQEKAPDYYGDLYSFLVRAGGHIMRNDNAGVMALVGAATE